ncbi:MAG: hypothetical protein WA864_10925 [Acetobacteraceae bacterium]|jgi:hypothetical protein
MKTILLAAAAMLCIGVGVAYAESGDDEGGTIPNTFFTELPGVISTAPGAPPNNFAVNGSQTMTQPTATSSAAPSAATATAATRSSGS